MNKIRALIVDDSAVIRRMLRESFFSDPALEVAGVAANGVIALSLLQQLRPDIVTLDIEMPEMDGLTTLEHIRKLDRSLPVIMFSTLTAHGAMATIEALSRGASDYVTKPGDVGNYGLAVQRIGQELIPKMKVLCANRPRHVSMLQNVPKTPQPTPCALRQKRVEIVAIGTSTGGPNALAEVLPKIPADFPVPILIVQHMPALFTRFLAERLNANSKITVAEAVSGQEVLAGQALIAPGDYHMSVYRDGTRTRVRTDQRPAENSCRPSVDVLFRSVAEVFGAGTLGVIMTGMGQDGLAGCERLRAEGGRILAQDEASSVVWGMPGFVARAGLADRVLPLNQLAPHIVRSTAATPGVRQ